MSKLNLPAIIVNFKCYLESTGDRASALAKICETVSVEKNVTIVAVPQFTDLARIVKETSIPIFSQHIDSVKPGSFTGHIIGEAVKAAGATGTLINHSERRLSAKDIEVCIIRAKELGLTTVVCADTPEMCKTLAAFKPDIIAIEPPELIGTGIPVSKAKPEIVTGAVESVASVAKDIPVLCGAGISTGDDVYAASKLGTKGVLLASGVVKAKNPRSVLVEMADALLRRV